MSISCWRFAGEGVHNDSLYEYFGCGTSASYVAGNGGLLLYLDGVNLGGSDYVYRSGTGSINVVAGDTPTPGFNTFGNCLSCNSSTYDCIAGICQKNTSGSGVYSSLALCSSSCASFDCLNGVCTQNTAYGTPGTYKSLIACNAACGGATCPVGQSCFDPNNLPCPVCPTCPACPTCPDCPDSSGICPPCGPCPSASSCPEGQTCQLPTGEDVNFVNIAAPIFLGTCDASGNPVLGSRSVRVIQGTETSEILKFQDLAQIQGAAVCKVDVAACPDGWLIRPEYHRPQVIYQFAQIDNSGKIIGAPKYKITVPHHLSAKPDHALPNYKRGNWEIIYVLKDNSKITIHSFDEDTGMSLLDAIKLLIIPSYLVGAYLSKSSIVVTDTAIAEITVKNRMAKYYSSGTKNDLPDWVAKW